MCTVLKNYLDVPLDVRSAWQVASLRAELAGLKSHAQQQQQVWADSKQEMHEQADRLLQLLQQRDLSLVTLDDGTKQARWVAVLPVVAGTAVSRTRLAAQSRAGGNLPPTGQPRHMRMRVAVCLHMQSNGVLYFNLHPPNRSTHSLPAST